MPAHCRSGRRAGPLFIAVAACLALITFLSCLFADGAALAAGSGYGNLFAYEGVLEQGDEGEVISSLQTVLDALGYAASADGAFGPETRSAVEAFQSDQGLWSDGIAGPATLLALAREYDRAFPPATHSVGAGETLSAIAGRYGLGVDALAGMNGLRDPNFIYEGQVLRLSGPSEKSAGEQSGDPGQHQGRAEPGGQDAPADVVSPGGTQVAAPPVPTRRTCLTFDDGPDISTTRPILAILDTYGVKATFFVTGAEAVKNPDLVREIAAAGHAIGIHGYDHKVLAGLSASVVRADLARARDAVSAITGQAPRLYRPPAGILDQTQRAEAAKLGLTTLMWTNIGGADLGASSAGEVVTRITAGAKDGGVILMHEGLQHTVEALPQIIQALARAGFGFQNVAVPAGATAPAPAQ